jgi:hypothetical protein
MSRSSTARRNYLKSKRRRIQDVLEAAKDVEVLDSADSSAIRDADGVWRPANQLKYEQPDDEDCQR